MDLDQLPRLLAIVLVFGVAALGVWYLAVRFNQSRLKLMAVMLGVFPLLVIGVGIASNYFDFSTRSDFTDTAVGPATREASVTRDLPFPVNDHSLRHEILLTPKARTGATASQAIAFKYSVKSPEGETLLEKSETSAPAQGAAWSVSHAEFQPAQSGEHTLHLEIPQGVGEVQVRVREIRK